MGLEGHNQEIRLEPIKIGDLMNKLLVHQKVGKSLVSTPEKDMVHPKSAQGCN